MTTSTWDASSESVKHSVHVLLNALIDYAGLFPPAGLPMQQAVENYARYGAGAYRWALGRFILPAARLAEFEQHFRPQQTAWRLSALLGANPAEDLARIAEFNSRHQHTALVDTLEAKAATPEEIRDIRHQTPESLLVYFEIPTAGDPAPLIAAIRAAHSRAKIRTGGLTQEMFPFSTQIIAFLRACVKHQVPFKATAGLHHPLRCTRPFTYEKDGPAGLMHGFINVFLAAALALEGAAENDLLALLDDQDPAALTIDDHAITWRNRRITDSRLLQSRGTLGMSFGSCSFEEPIEDLRALRLL